MHAGSEAFEVLQWYGRLLLPIMERVMQRGPSLALSVFVCVCASMITLYLLIYLFIYLFIYLYQATCSISDITLKDNHKHTHTIRN